MIPLLGLPAVVAVGFFLTACQGASTRSGDSGTASTVPLTRPASTKGSVGCDGSIAFIDERGGESDLTSSILKDKWRG